MNHPDANQGWQWLYMQGAKYECESVEYVCKIWLLT